MFVKLNSYTIMTRYEIPSESASNSSVTPNGENSQSRINSSDLESRMARLVGLEEEPQSFHGDPATFRQEPMSEPQDVQTEQSLSSNPFAKVGLVGAGTLALVLVAGAVLSQIMSGGHDKPKNIVTPQVRSLPTNEPRLQQQGTEIETLKTKLALAQQANDVKAAQEQLRSEKPTLRQPPRVQTPVPRQTVLVQRVPTSTRPYAQPRVVRGDRIVRVPQPEVQRTLTSQQQLPIVPPNIVPPTPTPTPDPLQEWSRLAKLGSYGQAPASNKQSLSTTAITQPAIAQRPPLNIQPYRSPTPVIPVASPVTQQQNPKSTVVGSSAKAKLVTAVYGETTQDNPYSRSNRNNSGNNNNNNSNNNSNNNNDVFVAQLTEPLKAADGSTILPKNTQLLFNVASTSEKGLMQLNVFKVTWKDKGNLIEKTVPPGALVLRGSGGPALAQQVQPKQGSHFASDIKTFLLGGAGQIGQDLNRPDQQVINLPSTTTVNGQTTATTSQAVLTQPRRDILASTLDGGGRAITPELNRRNQQAIPPRTSDRNNVWVIQAGKEVQLFVNQPTQL